MTWLGPISSSESSRQPQRTRLCESSTKGHSVLDNCLRKQLMQDRNPPWKQTSLPNRQTQCHQCLGHTNLLPFLFLSLEKKKKRKERKMQTRISYLLMLGRRNEYSRHQVRNQETENSKQTFRMRMQASWLAFKSYKGTRLSIPGDLKDAISWLLGLQRTSFFFSLVFKTLGFIIMQTANSPTGSSWVTSPGNITFQSCTSRIQYK